MATCLARRRRSRRSAAAALRRRSAAPWRSVRRLRGRGPRRARRDGLRLPRSRPPPRSHGRPQGHPPGPCARRRPATPLRARVPLGGVARPSPTSCPSTRPARPTGGCSSRCATSTGPTWARCSSATGGWPRAGGDTAAGHRRGARRGPRPGPRPSRRQAQQHPGRPHRATGRARLPGRLRAGQAAGLGRWLHPVGPAAWARSTTSRRSRSRVARSTPGWTCTRSAACCTRPHRRGALPGCRRARGASAHLNAPRPRPSQLVAVPRGFDQVVQRAMAREPADRFSSAGKLGLAAAAAAEGTRVPRSGRRAAARVTGRLRLALGGTVAAAALVLLLVLVLSGGSGRSGSSRWPTPSACRSSRIGWPSPTRCSGP